MVAVRAVLGCRADSAAAHCVAAAAAPPASAGATQSYLAAKGRTASSCVARLRCCSGNCAPWRRAHSAHVACCSTSGPHAEIATFTERTAETCGALEAAPQRQQATDGCSSWQAGAQAAPPAASLSRAFYSVQPARIARSAGSSGARGGPGLPIPSSLLIFVLTVGAAATAALRARLRSVRECGACRGYGLKRCKLCAGRGAIEWEGKMAHREPCPLCLGRRFTSCTCCGGGPFPARTMFTHRNSGREAGLVAQLASLTEAAQRGRRWPLGLGLLKDGGEDSDERMKRSDLLAEQIMMD